MLPRTPPTQVPRTYVNRPPPGSHLGKSMTTTTYATFTFVTKVPLRCLTTDLTMTTYVTRHFCYALRGRRQRLTVASSFSSLGHCEGASKAVSAVTSFSPLAFQFHLFQSVRLLLRVETSALVSPQVLLRDRRPNQHRTNEFFGFYWWLK